MTGRQHRASVRFWNDGSVVELSAESLSAVLDEVSRVARVHDDGRRGAGVVVGYSALPGGARRGHYEVCRGVSFGRGAVSWYPFGSAVVESVQVRG